MSLLGQDQDTVIEALKTLAENGERLKVTEKELEEVKNEVEDLKDENQQHQKEIRDLKDDLQYERNLNEDLEIDLKKAERQVDIFKHGIGNKDSIIDGLDKIIKEKGDEMNKLKEAKAIEEKKCEIQNNVIKELKDKLKEKEEIINYGDKEELDNLEREIKQLEISNKAKEELVESFRIEKESLLDKLKAFEEKTPLLENETLELELQDLVTQPFKCHECSKTFNARSDLRCHIRNEHEKKILERKLVSFELLLCKQKLQLSDSFLNLKEREIKKANVCSCRGFCYIQHSKHNWKKPMSDYFQDKLENLQKANIGVCNGALKKKYSCQHCEATFVKQGDLKKHKKTNHKTSTVICA